MFKHTQGYHDTQDETNFEAKIKMRHQARDFTEIPDQIKDQ